MFGEVFRYNKIYLGKEVDGDFVTVEELVDGKFVKYINNDGSICKNDDTPSDKAQSLVHFSYEKSNKEVMLVDTQGSGYTLYDPEIASGALKDGSNEIMFTTGNLSQFAIKTFIGQHKCNFFCDLLGLTNLQQSGEPSS